MKIVISATTSWNLYNSRLGLARALRDGGYQVLLLSPEDEFTPFLLEEGFEWHHFPVQPRGKNLIREIPAFLFLVGFYRKHKPDLVNHYTPKGVIYGSLAAKLARVSTIFNTITGLGYAFSVPKRKIIQGIFLIAYRIALAGTTVIFQNPDDQDFFYKKEIVKPAHSSLILSSGVDMQRFMFSEESNDPPVIMLSARFVEEKGIRQFVKTAGILKSQKEPSRFVVVGRPEPDQPTAIPTWQITNWVNTKLIEWWGWHNQMERIYPLASIVCLPTFYMEGVPKSLIEAAACGRPLIGTDVPGCREIIKDGENGFLVPPRNPEAMAEAILKLVRDASLRKRMGEKSREIAERDFSMEQIVKSYKALFEKAVASG